MSLSYDVDIVVRRRTSTARPAPAARPAPPACPTRPYAPGANDPVSGCPDDRVTKHAMNRSPWSHVAWSGA